MKQQLTADVLRGAALQLSQSEKGLDTLLYLQRWFEASACSLDQLNQDAVLTLLIGGAWGAFAGTAREAISEALEEVASCR